MSSGQLAGAPSQTTPIGPIRLVLLAGLMDVLGFGIMLPTLPFFARSLGAGPELITICMAVFTGGLFVSTPVWGRLSDRVGRKPVICIGLAGTVACYAMLAFAQSIWVVLVLRALAGIMAGNGAACTAYIVDVTSERDRAKYMGLSGAIFGFGFVAGPVIGSLVGGQSFGEAQFVRPALTAAGLSLVSLTSIVLFLPESRARREDSSQERVEKTTLLTRIRRLSPALFVVSTCIALYSLSSGFYETILPLWAADFKLIDGPDRMWMLILPAGVGFILSQAVLIGPLTSRYGERNVILYSAGPLALLTYSMTLAGSASQLGLAMIISGVMASLAALILASSSILASKLAEESQRGEVLGLFSSFGTLFRTSGMVVSGALYNQIHPHAPYWLAAATTLLIVLVAPRIHRDGASIAEPSVTLPQ